MGRVLNVLGMISIIIGRCVSYEFVGIIRVNLDLSHEFFI